MVIAREHPVEPVPMDFHPLIGVIIDGQWRPGIGDPTPMGWMTVVAYLAASLACWRAAAARRKTNRHEKSRSAPFWSLLSLILLFLAINKQLDLQSALTELGRRLIREQGWYDRRRELQLLFIMSVAGLGCAVLGGLGWMARRTSRGRLLALTGLIFLVVFIVVRASSFHRIDQILGLRLRGLRWNWLLELGGIGCVGLAALWSRRATRNRTTPRVSADPAQMRSLVREIWEI
jgi:hypothetical protein